MITLDFVKPKNKLKIQQYNNDVFKLIVKKITEIHGQLKFENELLKFVCTCVENAVIDSEKQKTDKKKLVLDIYHAVYNLSEADKLVISNSIDFVCNNKMIKKYSTLRKYSSIVGSYIKSKL
jgi:hypothetical protein